jgi:hypothetical protein
MVNVKKIIPDHELLKARRWMDEHGGGYREYLAQKGLMRFTQ